MNLEQARHNMIKQQIRPWDVIDERVLEAMQQIPREEFVPEAYKNFALADFEIPLNTEQKMMFPRVEGRLLQALDIQEDDNILEIGTGSGYVTALLAKLGKNVTSVEIDAELAQSAKEKLAAHGCNNASVIEGDGVKGWNTQAPYDVILIQASLMEIPKCFYEQLRVSGRMVAVMGSAPVMNAVLVKRLNANNFDTVHLFETDIAPLINQSIKKHFDF